jgi:hypothetical protein
MASFPAIEFDSVLGNVFVDSVDIPFEILVFRRVRRVLRLAFVAVFPDEALSEDGYERRTEEERPDAHVNEPRNGGNRVVGMERRKEQPSGKPGGQRALRGFVVPHFPEHQDIGILPQHAFQDFVEFQLEIASGIDLDGTGKEIFRRVFYRDDIFFFGNEA